MRTREPVIRLKDEKGINHDIAVIRSLPGKSRPLPSRHLNDEEPTGLVVIGQGCFLLVPKVPYGQQ